MSVMDGFCIVDLAILQSSLSHNWKARHIFEDLLKLGWPEGIVDLHPEEISHCLRVPLDVVEEAIRFLEQPDARSRTPASEGRRIVRLDNERAWGWRIVNWDIYKSKALKRAAKRSEANRKRLARQSKPTPAAATPDNGAPDITREMALAWLESVRKNGADYTERECLDAFLYFARMDWMDKGNRITDYRLALEERIQRERKFLEERRLAQQRPTAINQPPPKVKGSEPVNGF